MKKEIIITIINHCCNTKYLLLLACTLTIFSDVPPASSTIDCFFGCSSSSLFPMISTGRHVPLSNSSSNSSSEEEESALLLTLLTIENSAEKWSGLSYQRSDLFLFVTICYVLYYVLFIITCYWSCQFSILILKKMVRVRERSLKVTAAFLLAARLSTCGGWCVSSCSSSRAPE